MKVFYKFFLTEAYLNTLMLTYKYAGLLYYRSAPPYLQLICGRVIIHEAPGQHTLQAI